MPLVTWEAGCNQALFQVADLGNMDCLVIQPRAASERRRKHFTASRVIDSPSDDLSLELQSHRHAEHREPVGEVRSAVERIDQPAIVAALVLQAAFFTQDVVTGPKLSYTIANQCLRLPVSNRDQIGFAFVFHRNMLREILHQQRARFPRDLGHGRKEIAGAGVRRGHTLPCRELQASEPPYFCRPPSSEIYMISCLKIKRLGLS